MIERGQYDELGVLMISVAVIGLVVPVVAVLIFNPEREQPSRRTSSVDPKGRVV